MNQFKVRVVNGEFWAVDGVDEIYDDKEQAERAIKQFLKKANRAYEKGDLAAPYSRSEIEVVEV